MTDVIPISKSEPAVFTEHDRQMLHEIHSAITGIQKAIEQLPLDKLSKSPIFRMLGI